MKGRREKCWILKIKTEEKDVETKRLLNGSRKIRQRNIQRELNGDTERNKN